MGMHSMFQWGRGKGGGIGLPWKGREEEGDGERSAPPSPITNREGTASPEGKE